MVPVNINSHDSVFRCASESNSFQASPFSAFHFLRNYSYLVPRDSSDMPTNHFLSASHLFSECTPTASEKSAPLLQSDREIPIISMPQKQFGYWQQASLLQNDIISSRTNLLSPCSSLFGNNYKRQRGEKKPIPEEQKDDKYFERRRRNNHAAKKSRDARKIREDQVALKAAILEHENAILKAQILTLRDEASTLRQLLVEKKSTEF